MRSELRHAIGAALREARVRRGLSQNEASELLEVGREHYNRIERGIKLPSIELLVQMHRQLGISLDQLFSELGPVAAAAEPSIHYDESPQFRRLIHVAGNMSPRQLRLLVQLALNLKPK